MADRRIAPVQQGSQKVITGLCTSRNPGLWFVVAALLAAAPAWGETFNGTVVDVSRGDTLTVRDRDKRRHRVRLVAVEAPEPGQAFGPDSRRSLSKLLLGKRVAVERRKEDSYGRTIGKVLVAPLGCAACAPTRDAGLAQLEAGLAWWQRDERREQALADQAYYEYAEFDARMRRIGLWSDDAPQAPWEWRKRGGRAYMTLLGRVQGSI